MYTSKWKKNRKDTESPYRLQSPRYFQGRPHHRPADPIPAQLWKMIMVLRTNTGRIRVGDQSRHPYGKDYGDLNTTGRDKLRTQIYPKFRPNASRKRTRVAVQLWIILILRYHSGSGSGENISRYTGKYYPDPMG